MTDHRHPRCVSASGGLLITTSDTTTIDRLRARIAELEAQVDELMCWQVVSYADGELDAERADAFRLHLARCTKCQCAVVAHLELTARLAGPPPRSA